MNEMDAQDIDALAEPRRQRRGKLPNFIAFRPGRLLGVLQKWSDRNPNVSLSVLMRKSILANPEIRKLVTKKHLEIAKTNGD